MRNGLRQRTVWTAAALAAWSALAAGPSGVVLSNAELLRSSGNVTGSGFGSSSASFSLSSGSVGVLDWSTLNIASGESLNFGHGVWYNAVSGRGASKIAGSILGSGADVYLFNPNGVFFTSGSTVDVGSFTAAGFAMSNLDDLIANPALEPTFSQRMSGDIDVSGATFASGRVNLLGRNVFVDGSTFDGSLAIGAGQRVAVDSVGGGTVSFRLNGSSGDAAFVDSSAGKLNVEAMGNVLLASSGDLALGNVSAKQNVSAVSAGSVSVEGRIAAKKSVYLSAENDVSWTERGILRAGGNVHVESTDGSVALGSVSASKASVTAAGDVTGSLGAEANLLGAGEKSCATYRIDADGVVVVSFDTATVDVRGRGGVTLEAENSLRIAPVSVSTVRLYPDMNEKGKSTLVGTTVRDAALGGYQTSDSDIQISVPRNLTVDGTIRTISDEETIRPDTIRLDATKGNLSVGGDVTAVESATLTAGGSVSISGVTRADEVCVTAEGGNVSVGGRIAAARIAEIDAAQDIRIDGIIASDGKLEMTAGNAVALGENSNPLVSRDITITVDACGNPTIYEGGSEDGVLVLNRTKKGTTGKLTSAGDILLVDGSVAGGEPTKVAMMQQLEAVPADGNSALPVRDPRAALSASPFDPANVNAQLPGTTNEVVRDETALVRATKEEEPWMLKNVRK